MLFLSVPSDPSENFLRTLSRDNYDIDFGSFKVTDYVLLCLSLVSLVSLGKSKVLEKNSKPSYAICMLYGWYIDTIWMVYA